MCKKKERTCINSNKNARKKNEICSSCLIYTIVFNDCHGTCTRKVYSIFVTGCFSILVFDDLGEITRRHFKDLQTLVRQRRSQEAEQAPPKYPVAYNAPQQLNQYYSTLQHSRQQTNYYQTGPVQQHPPAPPLSGYSAGH